MLHDLAMELDEGLGSHVEEFARELHSDSADNSNAVAASKDDVEAEEDEDDEEGDDDDGEELPESL